VDKAERTLALSPQRVPVSFLRAKCCRLTIVGGVRERLVVMRRGRWKKVCARGARWALLGGPSTSPLGDRQRMSVPQVTVEQAISRGTRVVNGPVWALLATPAVVFVLAREYFHLDTNSGRFGIPFLVFFVACFVSAWLWWSVAVPRWRLWAYERVEDIPELKRRAVAARLTWPDGSPFSRTEIKSAARAQRERELELAKSAVP
jgi:hypothetical protein